MIKNKTKPSLLLPLAAASALIAGGGTAYWLFSHQGGGAGALPVGAEVVPQTALMAVSVTTEPGQWQKLREFGTTQSQTVLAQNLAQLRDRFLTANGYDYERDIQPWVGKEVTLAFLPAPLPTANTPATAVQPTTIVVLPIQNPAQAQQLLERPRPETGKLAERSYRGFQIREKQGTATTQGFSATVLDGKLLLVTTDPTATNQAIDTYKGGPALVATPGYTQALGKIQGGQSFAKLYVNLPAAATIATQNSGRSVPPQSLAQVQQMQGLAATASLQPEGILFKSAAWLKPDSDRKYEVQNNAKDLPSLLPTDTLVMASGGNLKRFWQDYSQGAAANPISPINPEGLRSGIKSTVGMDLDKDFLTWMEGEFSLSLVAAPEGVVPSIPFSFVLMVKATDRRTAETTLQQLDQVMAAKYKFKVDQAKVGSQTVTNWSLGAGGANITRGWLDNDVAFLSLGAPIAPALIPKPSASLTDSEAYKKSVPGDLNPNNGRFFINVDRSLNSKSLALFQLPPANRDLAAAVKSIGVTAAISDERTTRYDVFVLLQRSSSPLPLPSPKLP